MESTGVYWIPAFEILEAHGFEVILVNARYAKNVTGRKTDVSDAGWLRQMHSYGLLCGSFRPEAEIATLRAFMRQRERLLCLNFVGNSPSPIAQCGRTGCRRNDTFQSGAVLLSKRAGLIGVLTIQSLSLIKFGGVDMRLPKRSIL